MSPNPSQSSLLDPARWEALMQNAMDLWFRTTRRRLRRALRSEPARFRCGSSPRQLRDLGLSQAETPSHDHRFADAEAQLGMIR
jgi:hypothetical protein